MEKRTLTRRDFLRLSAVGTTGALIAACAPGAVDDKPEEKPEEKPAEAVVPAPEPVEVHWGGWSTGAKQKYFDNLAAKFNEAHPGIQALHEPAPWNEYWDRLLVQAASGEGGTDVMWMSGATFENYRQKGFFQDLTPYIEADGLTMDPYYDTEPIYKAEGKNYAWPFYHTTSCAWYNVEIFEEAGIDPPPTDWSDVWTWDELLETAQALTRKRDDGTMQYGYQVFDQFERCLLSFLWTNGADIMNEDYTKCTLDAPEAIEAIQFVVDLVQKYKVAPNPADPSVFIEGAPSPFEAGLIAVQSGKTYDIGVYQEIEAFTVAGCCRARSPKQGSKPYVSWVTNPSTIASASEVKDEAWEFVKFLASKEGMEELAGQKVGMPAMREVAKSELYVAPPPENIEVFVSAMDEAVAWDLRMIRLWLEFMQVTQAEMQLALVGEISAEEACRRATVADDEVLSRN